MAFEPFGNKFPVDPISQAVMMATYSGQHIDLTPTATMAEEAQRGWIGAKNTGAAVQKSVLRVRVAS